MSNMHDTMRPSRSASLHPSTIPGTWPCCGAGGVGLGRLGCGGVGVGIGLGRLGWGYGNCGHGIGRLGSPGWDWAFAHVVNMATEKAINKICVFILVSWWGLTLSTICIGSGDVELWDWDFARGSFYSWDWEVGIQVGVGLTLWLYHINGLIVFQWWTDRVFNGLFIYDFKRKTHWK